MLRRSRRGRLDAASAIALVIALVGIGSLAGVSVGRVLQRAPAPTTAPPIASPAATATLDTEPLVFAQPLVTGCATRTAVWVVSNGGGIARYEDDRWSLADPALRSLVAVACATELALAAGGAGRVVVMDDVSRTVRPDTIHFEDLLGVSLLPDGALAVGRRGFVSRLDASGWGLYARGIEEDLYAVAAFSPTSAWAVGANGATYRLEEAGWRPVVSGVSVTLRALAAPRIGDAWAVGDGGTIIRFADRWTTVESGSVATLRAVARVGASAWIVGDGGIALRVADVARPQVARVDLGTTCTLRGVFARGDEIWIVGSDTNRAAVWRLRGERVSDRWGACP